MSADSDAPINPLSRRTPIRHGQGQLERDQRLADDGSIKVDGLVLVSRRADGKIPVDDGPHTTARAPGGARSIAWSSASSSPPVCWWARPSARDRRGTGHHLPCREGHRGRHRGTLPCNSSSIVAVFESSDRDIDQDAFKTLSEAAEEKVNSEHQQVKATAGAAAGRDDLVDGKTQPGRTPAAVEREARC